MPEKKATYEYFAVLIEVTSAVGDPSNGLMQQMNNLGSGGFRFVGTVDLTPSQRYVVMERS